MDQSQTVSVFVAFVAGLLSFLSPCVLPLIPSYVFFITGLSLQDLKDDAQKSRIAFHAFIQSISFVAGFTLVFCLLGATASFLGQLLFKYQAYILKAGGVLIILFGIHLTGVFQFAFMQNEKRVHVSKRRWGWIGSFVIGVAFGAGWTPCVGPILGTILVMASAAETMAKGIGLLAVYSLGIGLPFIAATMMLSRFMTLLQKYKKAIRVFSVVSGLFLIAIGILLFTNQFTVLSGWLAGFTPEVMRKL